MAAPFCRLKSHACLSFPLRRFSTTYGAARMASPGQRKRMTLHGRAVRASPRSCIKAPSTCLAEARAMMHRRGVPVASCLTMSGSHAMAATGQRLKGKDQSGRLELALLWFPRTAISTCSAASADSPADSIQRALVNRHPVRSILMTFGALRMAPRGSRLRPRLAGLRALVISAS